MKNQFFAPAPHRADQFGPLNFLIIEICNAFLLIVNSLLRYQSANKKKNKFFTPTTIPHMGGLLNKMSDSIEFVF